MTPGGAPGGEGGKGGQGEPFRAPQPRGRYGTGDGSSPDEARSAVTSEGVAEGGRGEVRDGAGG